MEEQLIAATDLFNNENIRTEKADAAINTLISCFGDAYVDVVRHTITREELPDTYIQRMGLRGTPEEQTRQILGIVKNSKSYWEVIIRFPHETITNEFGKSVDIYDFFVKVFLKFDGTYRGTAAIKSTYTEAQFYSGYVHSHCPSVRQDADGIKEWKSMCFGSGPIGNTARLLVDPQCNSTLWVAFATELRQWVRTESVGGGPYFRMEHISNKYEEVLSAKPVCPHRVVKSWLKPLIKSYIRAERLKLGFVGKQYRLGTTFTEWLIDFSNYALAWGEKNKVVIPTSDTLVINNKICKIVGSRGDTDRYAHLVGNTVLNFKGEAIPLKIIQGEKVEHLNLISYTIGLYIIKNMLKIINYNYGRTETNATTTVQWG